MLEDAWLAGFIDGEGCFTIGHGGRGDRCWTHRFSIAQRADDGIIQRIARAFGGGSVSPQSRPNDPEKNLVVAWHCQSQPLARVLIAYLDEFPLRTRKANDYAIWRESFFFYLKHTVGGAGPTGNSEWLNDAMQKRSDQLKAVRKYRQQLVLREEISHTSPQAALF